MVKEIERKFLLKEEFLPKWVRENSSYTIHQGYIAVEALNVVRIRLVEDYSEKRSAVLGVKIFKENFREEFEYPIPVKDGLFLYNSCSHKLRKLRKSFKYYSNVTPNEVNVETTTFRCGIAEKGDYTPRYDVEPSRPRQVRVDVDHYPSGLRVVELEFQSIAESKTTVLPPFCGEEITGVECYSNLSLALSGKEE